MGPAQMSTAHNDHGRRRTRPISAGSPRALGLPKLREREGDRLALRPWPRLSAIHVGAVSLSDWRPVAMEPWERGSWEIPPAGLVGSATGGVTACRARLEAADVDIEMSLRMIDAERAGVVLGMEEAATGGVCVLLDASRGQMIVGRTTPAAYGIVLDDVFDRCLRPVTTGIDYALRILRRDRYTEVYLDDELVFSTVTQPAAEIGPRLAALVDSGRAQFTFGRVTELEPMGGGTESV